MKRIETLEDVKLAMGLNEYLKDKIAKEIVADQNSFRETNQIDKDVTIKKCKEYMAEALDVANSLAQLHLYASQILNLVDECTRDQWIPSMNECIEHYLDDAADCLSGLNDDATLYNLVIDDGKVYKLYENYCERDDKTFITREEYYPSSDDWDERDGEWEMPKQECVGWYAGEPNYDATTQFYGHLS